MLADEPASFKILGRDDVVYGPVELPVLVTWVQEQRVSAETWVYTTTNDEWRKALETPELRMFFKDQPSPRGTVPAGYDTELMAKAPALKPGSLRRIKVFAGFSDDQLARFVRYIEVKQVKRFAEVVHQGDPGDAMFLILEGDVRVRMMIAGKESLLAGLSNGDFFGEISLFDHGPRSADVIANDDTVLLRISVRSFEKMVHDAPDLAAPFLLAMGKTLTARIRADNKRFTENVTYTRMASSTLA